MGTVTVDTEAKTLTVILDNGYIGTHGSMKGSIYFWVKTDINVARAINFDGLFATAGYTGINYILETSNNFLLLMRQRMQLLILYITTSVENMN